jgi:branched-chain amino acid transport system ATP-binding protein
VSAPVLETKGLGIRFGGLKAVWGLDLSVGDREIVGLIGPNGAGKTTVFNLVTGIYSPTEGTIRLEGADIAGLPAHLVTRRGIARTFQNIRLFRNLPVLDNVLVGFHCRAGLRLAGSVLRPARFDRSEEKLCERARALLDLMGLLPRSDELAGNLSYGNQRRLEIARALASDPKLLLLDEPVAGMNMAERTQVMALVRQLRDELKLSILLIEHDMRVVMGLCERVFVLDHGVPIACGEPEAIQRDPAVIEAYLGRPEDAQPLRQRARKP